jgi:hypothetical protein
MQKEMSVLAQTLIVLAGVILIIIALMLGSEKRGLDKAEREEIAILKHNNEMLLSDLGHVNLRNKELEAKTESAANRIMQLANYFAEIADIYPKYDSSPGTTFRWGAKRLYDLEELLREP